MTPRAPLAISLGATTRVPRTAMVMAAGLGKRMRPLTATRPKPLVEVAGRSLIDHALDRLADAGVERAVVNVHYLADALEAHLRRRRGGPEIVISNERAQLLETGGGLVHAQPLLGEENFIAVNSDNLWIDGPVNAVRLLAQHWHEDEMDALLLLVPLARANGYRGRGDFRLEANGRVARRRPGRVAPFVFTGVQMISPRLLRDAPAGPFSTNILWDRAIADGRLYGAVHHGLWFDVGTPRAIPLTEAILANG